MSWIAACLLGLAMVALGQALQVKNGFLHDRALAWLVASVALVVAATVARARGPREERRAMSLLPLLLCGGVLVQTAQLLRAKPLLYAPIRHGSSDPVVAAAVVATAGLALLIVTTAGRIRRLAFAGIIAAHLVLGAWVVRTVPSPTIDVVTVNQAAIEAIASGRSPYSITFRNIYGKGTKFYGEGMASESEVRQGFPYPPLTLAFIAPAHWLLGDYRYALVAALAAAAWLIGSLGWTRHAMLGATLLLTTPRILFEIEQGWTEPLVVFLLALTAAVLWRAPSKDSTALGLLIAVKQYLAVALVLMPLLPRAGGPRWRRVVRSLAVAAAVTVPFAIWDPAGFMNSVVLLQLREPFREDSLSLVAWLARRGFVVPPLTAMAAAALVAVTLALRMLPRSAAAYFTGLALVTCTMFVFGKKAFCNYYFFVLGALAVAIGACGGVSAAITAAAETEDTQSGRSPQSGGSS